MRLRLRAYLDVSFEQKDVASLPRIALPLP